MPSPSDPAGQDALRLLVIAVVALFVLGDGVIVALWVLEAVRRRPILAQVWSVSHLFLGLQAVGAAVLAVAIAGTMVGMILAPGAMRNLGGNYSSPVLFFAVLYPSMLAQQAALVGVPAVLVAGLYRGTLSDLGLRWPDERTWRRFGWGVLIALALLPVNDLIETLSSHWILEASRSSLAPVIRDLSDQASAVRLLTEIRKQPIQLVLMTLVIAFVGPFAEEVFFRGFAYGTFKRRFGVLGGIVCSALLFSLIHGNPLALIPIFVMGVVLAWAYERTGSLAVPIGIHCANNLLVVLLYLVAPDFSLWKWLFGR